MSPSLREQLLDPEKAFSSPFVVIVATALGGWLAVKFILIGGPLVFRGRSSAFWRIWERLRERLGPVFPWEWTWSGVVLAVILGAGPTIILVGVFSLLCYREYARATGYFREKAMSLVVVLGILCITLASLDRRYRLFVSLAPSTIAVLAAVGLFADRPHGYIQRVAIGVMGMLLFGTCLGHVGYLANCPDYRPLLLWLLLASQLHHFLDFNWKGIPGPPLLPATLPDITMVRAALSVGLTSLAAAGLGWVAFQGTIFTQPIHLISLSLILGIGGPVTRMMLTAVRRDLNIPLPENPRLVDHVDGLILTAPAVFHFVTHHLPLEANHLPRFWTGT